MQPTPPLQAQFGIALGSDGRHRALLSLITGAASTGYVLDPDGADEFIDQLAVGLKTAVAQARQLNTGLIVPSAQMPVDLTRLATPNGHKH